MQHPSFAQYMEQCLYDAESGYYASGRVEFGHEDHFWTYPRILSPLFGWAIAEHVRAAAECWSAAGLLDPDETITILELGGGDGLMAHDVLSYVTEHAADKSWTPYSTRIEYVIGELSPALRGRQAQNLEEHIKDKRARVLPIDARNLQWDGPFKGVVVCNELIDTFPCERLRFLRHGGGVSRIHVNRTSPNVEERCDEELVPLEDGWLTSDGIHLASPPADLLRYLGTLRPLLSDLDACGLLPVDLFWPASLPRFVQGIRALLTGPERMGAALIFDYGGTSRHVLDPRSQTPHLRVFGASREPIHAPDAYRDPGFRDITCDVDFTELGRLARGAALDVRFYGHQSAIEGVLQGFDAQHAHDALSAGIARHTGYARSVARAVVPFVLKRFRRSPCFWFMSLVPNGIPYLTNGLGNGLPWEGDALWTVRKSVSPEGISRVMADVGLPPEVSNCLKPCGEIAADLSERGMLTHHASVWTALEQRGCLEPPGSVTGREHAVRASG